MRLSTLDRLGIDEIDIAILKEAGAIPRESLGAKVILAGEITRAVRLTGIKATKGARAAIEAVGGSLVDA